MAKKAKDFIIINGIKIEEDTVYEVTPKKPAESAPSYLKELGTEKYPAPFVSANGKTFSMVSNVVGFPYAEGRWDTGFYPDSAVFRRMGVDYAQAEILAKKYEKFIVGFLQKKGYAKDAEKLLDPDDTEPKNFFESPEGMVSVWEARQFNTARPKDRLELYTAILTGALAQGSRLSQDDLEEGLKPEEDGIYAYAQYSLVSKDQVRNRAEQKELDKTRAIGIMYSLLQTDKDTLVSLANYEGVTLTPNDTETVINQNMTLYFSSYDNVKSFLNTYDSYSEDDQFKDRLQIMQVLRNKKGLLRLQKEGSDYFLNGINLGSNEKQVSKSLASDRKLVEEFYKLL